MQTEEQTMRTLAIGLPHVNDFSGGFVMSLLGMCSTWGERIIPLEEEGALIDSARNRIFRKAQTENADYLLFVDSDMIFPVEALEKLISLNKGVATGVYYSRVYPHRPHVYHWTGETSGVHRNYVDIPTSPFKVDSCGAGFMLISKRVLDAWTPEVYQEFGRPFTRTLVDDGVSGATALGEDTAFCQRCGAMGIAIWADPTFSIGHKGGVVFTSDHWKQVMDKMRLADKTEDGLGDGWTTQEELEFLAIEAGKAKTIAEIGSWKGRSTKVLLDNTDGTVYAIDHFKGTDYEGDIWSGILADGQDIYGAFAKHTGLPTNLEVLRMSSQEAADCFADASLDMIFIDADHTVSGISEDIDNYLPKLKKGGLICGHDYTPLCPDVIEVVNNRFGDDVSVVGTIWYRRVA